MSTRIEQTEQQIVLRVDSETGKIVQVSLIGDTGSGTEFIQEAFENGADALVTGDLKFHTALDSPIVVFDIGHFESEIMVLDVFEKLINNYVKVVRAKEHSPLIYPF